MCVRGVFVCAYMVCVCSPPVQPHSTDSSAVTVSSVGVGGAAESGLQQAPYTITVSIIF